MSNDSHLIVSKFVTIVSQKFSVPKFALESYHRNKNEIKMAASAGVPAGRVTLDGAAGLVASHLRLAAAEGVGRVVARTNADLGKIKREFPDARVLLSLGAPKSGGGGNSGIFDQG